MYYIESPNTVPNERTNKLFLAGGITGCRDWQKEVIAGLTDLNIVIFNPRRANFPIDDPTAAEAQIRWEAERMEEAHIISFWFCKETLCPIVLFELGHWIYSEKIVIIGMDKEYQRRQDVEIQTNIARPGYNADIGIVTDIPSFILNIKWALSKIKL